MTALSIVIAVKDAAANVEGILARLGEHFDDVEVIFAIAGAVPKALSSLAADQRVIYASADTLIPHLWADGIRQASGARVALTTAQCIPAVDWVARLIAMDPAGKVAVGGALANDPSASALNWAIYFLRYSAFMPGEMAGSRAEIAADNAVYDRAAILQHEDLLTLGFWEPSFHERFRANGATMRFDPDLIVEHHGRVAARALIAQRFAHGREYGRARAQGAPRTRQITLFAASPLVPFVLYRRIYARVVRYANCRGKLAAATPWLAVLIVAWSLGEAAGYAGPLIPFSRGAAKQDPGNGGTS